MRLKPPYTSLPLRILCVLALVMAAFAHRPVIGSAADTSDLAAYAFPDGTLPVVCVGAADSPGEKHASGTACEFCRIYGAVLMPAPPDDYAYCPSLAANETVIVHDAPIRRRLFPPSAPPRGPPAEFV
jgi:hypothetical protein